MQLDSDDFDIFGLPRRFALDRAELDARRRRLQAEVHPDRFAAADPASRRLAMQRAVRVNEAYERLKDPLRRAASLCELNGAPIRVSMSLFYGAAVCAQLEAYRSAAYQRLATTLDESQDFTAAADQVRALMFVERFADDVAERQALEER